ncbi:DEAD/DEAH box helicase family protein, partial [[Ruminococcus] torques]
MKLQFKYQKFQADAAKAVADVFDGQPYLAPSYMTGEISGKNSSSEERKGTFSGWSNQKIVPELSDERILDNLRKIQKANQIPVSSKLEGRENGYHLTVEMETGVGKTYTYIKTIYELNKRYGWSKFLVVVPSIAIREGVYKTFQITREHFAKEYGKKIRFFIYNSERLTEIDRFASDNSVHVMIINSQAFNAKGKDARRIYMNLDEFQGRKPIDLIAGTNPIIIIDEPQSVEGRQTKERMKQFCPLITLRYSATHKADSLYNMVYRLSAADAYRKYLVKKIEVKGIAETKTMASDGYIYVERICCSESDAAAVIQYDFKMGSGIRKQYRKVGIGDDLYEISGGLEEYQGGFEVKQINRQEESVEFVNGMKLYAGDINGKVDEEQIRRIQIRETILSHIDRERRLFGRRIKVLSLFFIDEVARYKKYDETGCPQNGSYADIFEEEYRNIIENMKYGPGDEKYRDYIEMIPVEKTHAGYFSIDRKGHVVDSKGKGKEMMSDDQDAYDLIMKNKELLLECDPKQSPVRFIFSHSALREGWDNPNVFQICTLKNGGSEVRKRQEVGRGLRLCVNGDGQRMDRSFLGQDVHRVNTLTVIASESYESFVKGLQSEIAEDVFGKQSRKADVCRDIEVIIPENARSRRVELKVDQEKLNGEEFSALWSNICLKSTYTVNFDTEKLVEDAVKILNRELHIQDVRFKGKNEAAKSVVKYDLAGKLADMTGLKRKTVIEILSR